MEISSKRVFLLSYFNCHEKVKVCQEVNSADLVLRINKKNQNRGKNIAILTANP